VIGTFPQFQGGITVVQPEPQSSMATTTVTSGVSQSYGGNVGFNQSQLANVTASAGVTISRTESTTVPPITVQNAVDTETGVTSWTYFVNDLPSFAETIDVYQQWIWQVPFNLYPTNATSFQYTTGGSMLVDYGDDSDYELDTP
jgi:hypothetical protein